jgi:carboxypeptidase C (cathepsin A)
MKTEKALESKRYRGPIIGLVMIIAVVSAAAPAKKAVGPLNAPDSLRPQKETSTKSGQQPAETLAVTDHAVSINGKQIRYKALCGLMNIPDSSGQAVASIFYTAYLRQPETEINHRPIAFAFNGGPGASSMWLHLAAMGPRRAVLGENGVVLPSVDSLTDNQYTWLPFMDMVFVDPVGTGYSRPAPGTNAERYYTVKGDIKVMAEFIRLFLSRNGRWTSPLYLTGESYGTLRAAGLGHYLQNTVSKAVTGIIFISSVINFQDIAFDPGNDIAYALAIPSYTATALFHEQLPSRTKAELAKSLECAEQWAMDDYLLGLSKRSALLAKQRTVLIDSLAAFTGLSRDFVRENGLRIAPYAFIRELLAKQDKTIGMLDGRTTGVNAPPMEPYGYRDPSMFVAAAPLTALINDYLRRELLFSTRLDYIFLSDHVNRSWQWSEPSSQGYVDESGELRSAMSVNKNLRVFAAMGYYDLATPYLSQRYSFEHLASDSAFMGRIRMKSYPAGHQIYTFIPALKQLTEDVEGFVTGKNRP